MNWSHDNKTLRALRQVIKETIEELDAVDIPRKMEFEEAQQLMTNMSIQVLKDYIDLKKRGVPDSVAGPAGANAVKALNDEIFKLTGWTAKEINERTHQDTWKRIQALKAEKASRIKREPPQDV